MQVLQTVQMYLLTTAAVVHAVLNLHCSLSSIRENTDVSQYLVDSTRCLDANYQQIVHTD